MNNDRFKVRFWDSRMNEYANCYCIGSEGIKLNYIIPELSTGINDKNGKLIYEGDIVKIETSNSSEIGVVKWLKEDAKFIVYVDIELELPFYGNIIEVIGNINENKELIYSGKLKDAG